MGRQRVAVSVSPEVRDEVERLLRQRTLTPRVRERLEMVKAAALGQDLRAIATWSGRSRRTVLSWLARFAQGGSAALRDAPRSGRPPRADAAYHAALETAMTTSPRTLGLPYDVWTSARLSAYLAAQTGVVIAPSWLRSLLQQHRFVTGRPKHTLQHLQDAREVEACRAALAEAGEKGGSGTGEVRVAP